MIEHEEFFDAKPERLNERTTFLFPASTMANQEWISFTQVAAEIEKMEMLEGLPQRKLYRKKNRSQYYYLMCRYCRSVLSMKMDNSLVKFVRFDNVHVHNGNDSKRDQEVQVLSYIVEKLDHYTPDETRLLAQ